MDDFAKIRKAPHQILDEFDKSLSKTQANPEDLSANKDFTAQSVSPKEKINVLLCCDCKAELIDDDVEEDRRKSIRCPECWAKMEEETNLED